MNDTTIKIANTLCKLSEEKNERIIVAIAGPPASGKSTLAENLVPRINQLKDSTTATIVPMDGYHLDNAILDSQQTRDRKGAPHTFDVHGFISAVKHIANSDTEVFVPVFDRRLDLARAGARCIVPAHSIILVEGNYLLMDKSPWSDLHPLFDYTIFLDVAEAILIDRLTQRWFDHGHTKEEAVARANANDIPNAKLVSGSRLQADITLTNY